MIAKRRGEAFDEPRTEAERLARAVGRRCRRSRDQQLDKYLASRGLANDRRDLPSEYGALLLTKVDAAQGF